MNCPSCGKEMERGKVITSHSGGDIDALFLTRKYITRQNGIVLDGPYNTDFPNESSFSACVCRDCRKIMLTY